MPLGLLKKQLTGPVDRNDVSTVKKHLEVMNEETKRLYIEASKYALNIAKVKNPDVDYTELNKLLQSL